MSERKHPKGLYTLFFTEMWERFGYYLLLGILFLYMTDDLKGGLGYGDGQANEVYGTYLALVYLTPFVGGLLADRIFGYRKTIIFGGALMGLGYLLLAMPGEMPFYIALGLVIVGNGFFKPNISTMLGNLYNDEKYKLRKDQGYNIFYMGINVGAFICNFIAAYMRNNYGWGYAFAAAGVGMFIGLAIFMSRMKNLAEADVLKPARPEDMPMKQIFLTIFVPAIVFAGIGYFLSGMLGQEDLLGSKSNDAFIFACIPVTFFYARTYMKASEEDKKPVGALLYIFFVVIIFWAIFHQNGNVLTAWAERNTWRPIPESLQPVTNVLGFSQEVDAAPGCVMTKQTKEGEKHKVQIAASVTPLKADSIVRQMSDSGLSYPVQKQDIADFIPEPGKARNQEVFIPVSSRVEGTDIADKLHEKKFIKELKYNDYLETLPKDQWPGRGETLKLFNTELFQSLNPGFVVLFTPLLIAFFAMLRRRNSEPSTPGKIAWGLMITGLSTLVMVAAVAVSNNGADKVSYLWLVGTYAVITVGELFLSPMGLSLVSKLSPTRITALMMGGWFLSTSIGNKLSGVLGHLGSDSANKSLVFWINFGGATLSAILLFIFVKKIRGILRTKTGHD